MSELNLESTRLNQWRELLKHHQEAITRFESAKHGIGQMLQLRNKRLAGVLADRIEDAGLRFSWEHHNCRVQDDDYWNAYCFVPEDWSIELKLAASPSLPAIYVMDYPGRTYADITIEPLGLDWTASDQDLADAFVERVNVILDQVRQGTRTQH